MTNQHQEDYITFSIPGIDPQDIQQEIELLKLEGITPRRSLIRKRLQTQANQLLFNYHEVVGNTDAPEWMDHRTDSKVIEQIAQWALTQSLEVQDRIFRFLENPTTRRVNQLIKDLVDSAILSDQALEAAKETQRASGSLVDIITRELSKAGPKTLLELYDLEDLIISKRPRAAIRQTLRRLVKQGKVKFNDDLYSI